MGICNLVNTSLCLLESIFCKILSNKTTVGQHSRIHLLLQKPFPNTSSAPGRQVSMQEPCSQEGARFSPGVQVHTREPALSSEMQVHARELCSCQGMRFSPGIQILARESGSHQGSMFREMLWCAQNPNYPCLTSQPASHRIKIHPTTPSHLFKCLPCNSRIFFFKGKENKHSDSLGI